MRTLYADVKGENFQNINLHETKVVKSLPYRQPNLDWKIMTNLK